MTEYGKPQEDAEKATCVTTCYHFFASSGYFSAFFLWGNATFYLENDKDWDLTI